MLFLGDATSGEDFLRLEYESRLVLDSTCYWNEISDYITGVLLAVLIGAPVRFRNTTGGGLLFLED